MNLESMTNNMKKVINGFILFSLMLPLYGNSYTEDWNNFTQIIEKDYPFFKLKGIRRDWVKTTKELEKRVSECDNDSDFLVIINDSMKCLRDGHAGISKSRVPFEIADTHMLPFAMMPASNNRVVVMAPYVPLQKMPFKTGTVILSINGKPARAFLDRRSKEDWLAGGHFSSPQRAAVYTYRMPCRAEEISDYTIEYLDGVKKKQATLKNDFPARGWAHVYNMPGNLTRTKHGVSHTVLDDGIGYMHLRSIRGDDTTHDIANVFSANPQTSHWIIDLRGNGGGGYNPSLIEIFEKIAEPIAIITDAGCFSAGETVVRDLKKKYKVRVFGSTTAGSSSSKKQWTFPSGIATIRFSTKSHSGENGKPLEFYGMAPDVFLEAIPEEVIENKNTEIMRAQEFLKKYNPDIKKVN